MIRIPTEIDKVIMDGKIDIRLDKSKKVLPIEFDKVSTNSLKKEEYIKSGTTSEDNVFQGILDKEIEKITLK